ncbi:hypothetical protein KTR9_0670 [Gordonia sp. KTR9]|nr:hypothetical protein KTR9_0670 [Gordonia sp. KTR9]
MSAPHRDLITRKRMNRAGNISNYQLRGYGSGFGIRINRNIEFRECSDNATSNDVSSDLNGPKKSSAAGAAARHQPLNRNSSAQVPESLPSSEPPPIEPASPSPPMIASTAPPIAPARPPSTMPAISASSMMVRCPVSVARLTWSHDSGATLQTHHGIVLRYE